MVGCDQILARKMRLVVDGLLKVAKLPGREDDQEGLKQNYGFPEAGSQVIVARVHFVPSVLGIRAQAAGEIIGRVPKVAVQVLHHFLECADLMKELKPVGKQHPVHEAAHACGTLSLGSAIILGIQRSGVRHGSIVFGMVMQRSKCAGKRVS